MLAGPGDRRPEGEKTKTREVTCGRPWVQCRGEYEVAPLCPYRLYVPCVQHRRREKGGERHPPR